MMRLKRLLGVGLLGVGLMIPAGAGAAAGSQLTKVSVAEQGKSTTVILQANSAFTHAEYRPTENLMLIDLQGVAAGMLKDTGELVNRPGVDSYRVVSYLGSNGSEVTRVELILSPSATVKVAEGAGELRVTIDGSNAVASQSPTTATPEMPSTPLASAIVATPVETSTSKPVAAVEVSPAAVKPAVRKTAASIPPSQAVAAAKPAAADKPALIRGVSVERNELGMTVQINASSPVQPVGMRLDSPDRIVVDIPNSMLASPQRPVAVNNGALKMVRVGRYQSDPPVTRIVLDLASKQDYELTPQGNKVMVTVLDSAMAQAEAPASGAAPQQSPASVPAARLVRANAVETTPAVSMIKPAAAKEMPAETVPVTRPVPQPEVPREKAEAAAKVMQTITEPAPLVIPQMSAVPAEAPVAPQLMAQATPPPQAPAAQTPAQQAPQQTPGQYTGEPISVNLKDVDLQDFFRLVHEISGLNIVLDPAVKGTLTLVLDDVPWDQALDIVLQNNGLDRRLEGNVLRIATRETFIREAETRRAQAEAQALAVDPAQYTHYLSYAHAADLVPVVRRFLSQRGEVLADPRTNALLIKDIPASIPQVQKLLAQLDRKTQEVEIEARVVAATRNFARDIGTQLGFGWGNSTTAIGGGARAGTSPLSQTYVGPPPYITTPGFQLPSAGQPIQPQALPIPLFSNLGVLEPTSAISLITSASGYRVDAILTMAERRGLLKILSRPRVVTQNNIGATVKQGVRVPVVTAAQLGGPPTVTYVEAALRLQVTPQVTAENTIFLNVDVENTTPDFSRQVQGNPTLISQQATTSVLVQDGGTVVIGGVIQTQNSVNVQQIPLLGDIPMLGNLFKRRSVETTTQELIFFITPRIVQT